MKKYLFGLLTIASALFAEETNTYSYVQMGIMGVPDQQAVYLSPAVGSGCRIESESGILDIGAQISCASFNGSSYVKKAFQLTFPKVLYLKTIEINETSQMYLGGGMGFGFMNRTVKPENQPVNDLQFTGFIGDLAIGYKLPVKSQKPHAIQLEYQAPLLAAHKKGDGPLSVVQFSYLVGF